MPGAINPATKLAQIRSRIDAQQRIVDMLEFELQKAILGGNTQTRGNVVNGGPGFDGIADIYDEAFGSGCVVAITELVGAVEAGLDEMGHVTDGDPLEQDALRQLLYQARALLGELRIEEQAWNGEVNTEKQLRKEINDFAKL